MKGFIPDLQKIHDQIGEYKNIDSVTQLDGYWDKYRRMLTSDHYEAHAYLHTPDINPIWSNLFIIRQYIIGAREEKNTAKKKEYYNKAAELKRDIKTFIKILEKYAR